MQWCHLTDESILYVTPPKPHAFLKQPSQTKSEFYILCLSPTIITAKLTLQTEWKSEVGRDELRGAVIPEVLIACISLLHRMGHMNHTAHPPRFPRPNNIWCEAQIMKFLVIQLLLLSSIISYLLTPKYLPQHPILENSPSVFLPYCNRRSFPPTQNNSQNHRPLHLSLYIFRQQKGKQTNLQRMVADSP